MSAVTLSSGDLTTAIGAANTMATSVGGTFSANAGWLVLIATAGLLVFVVFYIMRRVARLGRH